MERRSATKRSRRHAKDEAVTSYWNNQRVVPTKVNGKTTYVIISTGSSSDEHSGRGCGTRHQELFPPEVTRHNVPCTSGSGLRRHTVSKYHAVDIVASHNGTDISPTCSKGHGKDCRFYANGGSSSGEASVISLAQKYEQEMFVTEKPSTTLDNAEEAIVQGSSNSSLHNTYKQSAVVVQESWTSDEQDVEASPNLLGSDMDDCNSSNRHANLQFYLNCIKSQPAGEKIEHILRYWYGDYELLEDNHNYIQWLFPTKSLGVNRYAQPLTDSEAQVMRTKRGVRTRLIQAYKMMLDFYGLELCSVHSGRVARAANWKERFHHLNHSHHNYQRITRILDSVGMLGAARLQVPLVSLLVDEIFLHKTLPNAASSCRHYWIPTVLDGKERQKLFETVNSLKNA